MQFIIKLLLSIINILVLDSVIGASKTKGKTARTAETWDVRNKLNIIAGRRCLEGEVKIKSGKVFAAPTSRADI